MPARLACNWVYDRVLTSALHEDLLTAEQRRESAERYERVVAEVDGWLGAGAAVAETAEDFAERAAAFATQMDGEVA